MPRYTNLGSISIVSKPFTYSQIFITSSNFIVPAGVRTLFVTMIGGGGGSGGGGGGGGSSGLPTPLFATNGGIGVTGSSGSNTS
jgi:hypothetical protein